MIHANSICQEFLAYKTAARIDIQIEITPVPFKDISKAQPGEPSAAIRERVVRARHILKVARTIADSEKVASMHIAEAIGFANLTAVIGQKEEY